MKSFKHNNKNNFLAGWYIDKKICSEMIKYFDITNDLDIGKVDPDYLYETLCNMDLGDADALFVSCTALPALSIIDKLEKKLKKTVLSSNQVLIWDTLQSIGKTQSIEGFGKLFNPS